MSFVSILSNIGSKLKKFFTVGEKIAVKAEPFIAVAFPGISPLFDTVVTEIGHAEAAAIAAGAQNGTGAQKLASVVAAVKSDFESWATQNGYAIPNDAQVTAAVNGVVAFLNALNSAPNTAQG